MKDGRIFSGIGAGSHEGSTFCPKIGESTSKFEKQNALDWQGNKVISGIRIFWWLIVFRIETIWVKANQSRSWFESLHNPDISLYSL